MFHKNDVDDGDGRSIRDELISFVRGASLIIWGFIKRLRRGLGLDCGSVR